jgi:DNA-binding HxlR family transcriptional regulator
VSTSTAAQRRDRQAEQFNANLRECPGHEVLAVLSDKWVTLVLAALDGGPLRHGELAREVAGASQKMLTQTLRRLERNGLVARLTGSGVPTPVSYELTPLGESLLPVQRMIKHWAETHVGQVHDARARYDAAQGAPDQSR